MRKIFELNIEGKHRDRLLDAAKHDLNRYLKRERRRQLPEDADFWDFDCRFGLNREDADVVHLSALPALMDKACLQQAAAFYVEVLAKLGHRKSVTPGASLATPD